MKDINNVDLNLRDLVVISKTNEEDLYGELGIVTGMAIVDENLTNDFIIMNIGKGNIVMFPDQVEVIDNFVKE